MAAAAHNPAFAKKVGVPVSVAKDFNKADKGKKFGKGGETMKSDIKQDKAMAKKAVGMHEKQMHGGKKSDLSALKKGGSVKKAVGGPVPTPTAPTTPTPTAPTTTSPTTTRAGMPSQSNAGGAMRGLARAAAMSGRDFSGMGRPTTAGRPETAVRPMKKGGKVAKYARGGGIEVRGKTRGKMC